MIGETSIITLPGSHKKCDVCREDASSFARCPCGVVIARCGAHGDAYRARCHPTRP